MGTLQTAEAGAAAGKAGRRRWSKLERRQIVEETLKAGASVSLVARAHDVNTNQVFKWRRQYLAGLEAVETSGTLLPVKITDAVQEVAATSRRKSRPRQSGVIDIDLGHARLRIEGAADADCVRAALEGLRR